MASFEVSQWRSWRWECSDPARDRHRYYVIHLQQDLWGRWELYQAWGGLSTRRGQDRVVLLNGPDEALPRVKRCHRRRVSHGYRLVEGDLEGEDLARIEAGGCAKNQDFPDTCLPIQKQRLACPVNQSDNKP